MVRIQPDYPEGFKGIKQHLPTAYAGKSDIEVFDSWLHELLEYFNCPRWLGLSGMNCISPLQVKF